MPRAGSRTFIVIHDMKSEKKGIIKVYKAYLSSFVRKTQRL